ncbi:MAG: hypothetical protein WCQ95_09750 [Bacteroidota bacterium]
MKRKKLNRGFYWHFLKTNALVLIAIGILLSFMFSCKTKVKYGGPPSTYKQMPKSNS